MKKVLAVLVDNEIFKISVVGILPIFLVGKPVDKSPVGICPIRNTKT